MNSQKSTVSAAEFAAAIKKVSAVLKKSQFPDLENICVEFTGSGCRLKGTDLAVYMTAEIPAEGDTFSFVFSNTANIVRACAHYEGNLEFELWSTGEEQKLTVRSSDKGGEFPVYDAKMYPEFPTVEPTERYSVKADTLYERVKHVRYASEISESKPALSGVRFEGNHVWCVDGMRLAVSDDEAMNVEPRFIVPAKNMEHLKAFGSGNVEIAVEKKYVMFSSDGLTLICRQLATDDTMKIENIVPKVIRESYYIDRAKYLDTLKYLGEFTRGRSIVYVRFNNGTLTLYDRHTDSMYNAKVETDGVCEIPYTFELRYMKDALEQFPGEKYLRIDVSGESTPFVVSADGANMRALILPARIRQDARDAA